MSVINFDKKQSVIMDYWKGLFTADKLSVDKALSEASFSGKADFEIEEVSYIKNSLGFGEQALDKFRVDLVEYELHLAYRVYFDERLLYEEPIRFDDNDLILSTGNSENCDLVEKFNFNNGNIVPSFGVRVKDGNDILAIVLDKTKPFRFKDFIKGETFDGDAFFNVTFPEMALGLSEYYNVSLLYKDSSKNEKLKIWINGISHPDFCKVKASIDGKVLSICNELFGKQIPWGLAIYFSDGTSEYINFPSNELYKFDKEIEKCVLSDALDNDWFFYAG